MSDFERVLSGESQWSLRRGSCLELLRMLPDACADACVTDPPYELSSARPGGRSEATRGSVGGFMGMEWDNTGIAFSVEFWRELLRVLKPGAHLLSFGGTRTYHRMACAIEDAGFAVRDSVHWIYGSGFPHYLNVSKAIDKADGLEKERVVVGTYTASGNAGTSTKDKGGTFAVGAENSPPIELKRTIGATDKSRAWDGWATALRPSHEPIVVARKPFNGTVVENILANGVGALNIDACRVPRNAAAERGDSWAKSGNTAQPDADKIAAPPGNGINSHPLGGWPGNVVLTHDFRCLETSCVPECPCHVMGEMSGESTSPDVGSVCNPVIGGRGFGHRPLSHENGKGDSGTAARYFNQSCWTEQDDPMWPGFYYCGKTSTAERELGCEKLPKKSAAKLTESQEGAARLNCPSTGAGRTSEGRANFHPTVKPLELMRWLCKLVTPKNGIIIEPFGGSGSGIMAPILEGFRCVASELTEDYWPIIEARVAWAERERFIATRQLNLFGDP